MSKHLAALCLASFTIAPAGANLLQEGDFDSNDLSGWTPDHPEFTTLEWLPRDGTDNIFSGSLEVTKETGTGAVFVTTCFERPPGARFFELGGRIAILDDQGPQTGPDNEVTALLGADFLSADSEADCLEQANGFGADPQSGPQNWTDVKNWLEISEGTPDLNWGFVKIGVERNPGEEGTAIFDAIYVVTRQGGCFPFEGSTCYLEGRFRVSAEFSTLDETSSGPALAAHLKSDNSGVLTFFGPDNWEIMIKLLDACSFNDRFWVFLAATTNQQYRIEVRDMVTGAERVYEHPGGPPAPAVTDTNAFATCDS